VTQRPAARVSPVMTRLRLAGLAAALSLLFAATALAGGSRSSITIRNFAFGPRVLRIRRGSTVLITNRDSTNHSFTSVSGKFDLSNLRPGSGSGRVRFTRAGTYHYFCAFHPYMRGVVVVR
jgi:plastocyanin